MFMCPNKYSMMHALFFFGRVEITLNEATQYAVGGVVDVSAVRPSTTSPSLSSRGARLLLACLSPAHLLQIGLVPQHARNRRFCERPNSDHDEPLGHEAEHFRPWAAGSVRVAVDAVPRCIVLWD